MILDFIQVSKITSANIFLRSVLLIILALDKITVNAGSHLYSLASQFIYAYALSRLWALTRLSSLATKSLSTNKNTRDIYKPIHSRQSKKFFTHTLYSFEVVLFIQLVIWG